MRTEKIVLWKENEYFYPQAYGFVPNLVSYLHEDREKRPCMIVVPGGGYRFVSPSEGEVVALDFYHRNYNVFVCTYTVNLLDQTPLKMQPVKDLSRAVRYLRKNAEKYGIFENRIAVCGFSAGAHLCASLCVHFEDVCDEDKELSGVSNRPDAAILSYPVIAWGEMAHKDSFAALLGKDAAKEELEYMSLEKHVTEKTPPCFLWQTVTDATVPVENSYLFARACHKAHVTFAHHVFPWGEHGLSLSNRKWAEYHHWNAYTLEQNLKIARAIQQGILDPGPEKKKEILQTYDPDSERGWRELSVNHPVKAVEVWPALAREWLDFVWG